MKLNLGGTEGEKYGHITCGLDNEADVKHDLNQDFPFSDNSIDEIFASHILEHLDDPFHFFAECYRIMTDGARLEIHVPHVTAWGASFGTFEHKQFFHESAIDCVTGKIGSSIFPHQFKHVETHVKRAKWLIWQKREIVWILEK